MKYFKDARGEVYGFAADGSQDAFIPSTLVAITTDEADALRFPPKTPAQMWGAIKAKRDTVKNSGVRVGTKWYHSDEASRTQYIGLLRMADAAVAAGGLGSTTLQYNGQDIQWKTMDGTFIEMTVQRANDVFAAISGLDFAAFGVAETHKAAMESSADPAAYDFSGGWPATFEASL
jgi:hypothetical protein